jgi:hypothetical protein
MKSIISLAVLFLGILLLNNSCLYGQSAIEIDNYLENNITPKSSSADIEILRSLYYDFNATVVLSKDNMKVVGQKSPKVILINLSDIDAVYENNSDYSEIEILIVSIEDEKSLLLDLNKLNLLPKLKYIVFKSDVVVNSKDINSFIVSAKDVNYTLLYDISIAE